MRRVCGPEPYEVEPNGDMKAGRAARRSIDRDITT
jgi:hypothetical protein